VQNFTKNRVSLLQKYAFLAKLGGFCEKSCDFRKVEKRPISIVSGSDDGGSNPFGDTKASHRKMAFLFRAIFSLIEIHLFFSICLDFAGACCKKIIS